MRELTQAAPRMTQEIHDALRDGLDELDAATSGPARARLARSVNARAWLDAAWPTLAGVEDGVDVVEYGTDGRNVL